MSNWKKIFTSSDPYLPFFIQGMLNQNDIEVVLLNKKDEAYHFGDVELYVEQEYILKAVYLINQNIFSE